MKNIKRLLYFGLLACLTSCFYSEGGDDGNIIYQSQYEAITQNRDVFENTILVEEPRPISNAGKIYIKDQYVLINEHEEGFHLFNNINPESPEPISYFKIQGATDLAIRGNTIFVHHLVDLVAIEYNFQNNSIVNITRSLNVFPRLNSPDGFTADYFNVPQNEIILGYQLKN